jgi:hypothetical protein
MSWTSRFSSDAVSSASNSFASYEMSESFSLVWEQQAAEGTTTISDLIELYTDTTSLSVTLPEANAASVGSGSVFTNTGSVAVTLLDAAAGTVCVLQAGQARVVYITDNSTTAGVWSNILLGTTTSAVDAASIAGKGLYANGDRLDVSSLVVETTSNRTISNTDKGKVLTLTSGSATFTLPALVASTTEGFPVCVHNAGLGTLTIATSGGATIDGESSLSVAPDESTWLVAGTVGWYKVGYGRTVAFAITQLVLDVTAGGTFTLTSAQAANKMLQLTGTSGYPTVATTIIVPGTASIYFVQAAYNGSATTTVKTAGAGSTVNLSAGQKAVLYCDGVNVTLGQSTTVGTTIGILDGTVSNPALYFSSEAGTGVYRASAGVLGLAVLGVLRFSLSATGATVVGTLTVDGLLNEKHGADIASANTINLTTATGNLVDVTGTTTITTITLVEGAERTVRFTGALTLTNGASLVLPGGINIKTVAGDCATFRGYAAGVVRCVNYSRMPAAANLTLEQITTTGSGNTFVATPTVPWTAYTPGQQIIVELHHAAVYSSIVTVNVSGLGALELIDYSTGGSFGWQFLPAFKPILLRVSSDGATFEVMHIYRGALTLQSVSSTVSSYDIENIEHRFFVVETVGAFAGVRLLYKAGPGEVWSGGLTIFDKYLTNFASGSAIFVVGVYEAATNLITVGYYTVNVSTGAASTTTYTTFKVYPVAG